MSKASICCSGNKRALSASKGVVARVALDETVGSYRGESLKSAELFATVNSVSESGSKSGSEYWRRGREGG
jgi:hypothetical protein